MSKAGIDVLIFSESGVKINYSTKKSAVETKFRRVVNGAGIAVLLEDWRLVKIKNSRRSYVKLRGCSFTSSPKLPGEIKITGKDKANNEWNVLVCKTFTIVSCWYTFNKLYSRLPNSLLAKIFCGEQFSEVIAQFVEMQLKERFLWSDDSDQCEDVQKCFLSIVRRESVV